MSSTATSLQFCPSASLAKIKYENQGQDQVRSCAATLFVRCACENQIRKSRSRSSANFIAVDKTKKSPHFLRGPFDILYFIFYILYFIFYILYFIFILHTEFDRLQQYSKLLVR